MRLPSIHYAESLKPTGWPERQLKDGSWAYARTEPFYAIGRRLKATWLVFTGRADALIWKGQ